MNFAHLQQGTKQRRRPKELLATDFAGLSARSRKLFLSATSILTFACLASAISLLGRAEHLITYLSIVLPMLLGMWLWTSSRNQGFPLFPLLLVQQGMIYSVPIIVGNDTLTDLQSGTLTTAGWAVGGFLLIFIGGWSFGNSIGSSQPSRGNLSIVEGARAGDRCFNLALLLLVLSVLYQLSGRSGLLFALIPRGMEGLIPIIRVFSTAASLLGGLLGGLIVGSRPASARNITFWVLLSLIFLLSVADVLISAASGLVLATMIGLALGKRRIPWVFSCVVLCLVGFLNQGKFIMRERYWSDDGSTTSTSVLQLPSFYMEWATASADLLFDGGDVVAVGQAHGDEEGQSFLHRIDSMQNMTFIVEAIRVRDIDVLSGRTYSLIPPLFVPRFLWPGKPRTHAGQVLLNVHFGRQDSVEQTEKTYIAWGLLPEALGNFGIFFGPLLLGGFLGVTVGWLEKISMRKRIFSVEGMMLSGLLLIMAGSYEMVASILLTSTFQFMVVVTISGFAALAWFGIASPFRQQLSAKTITRHGSDPEGEPPH